ncbi:hypothetical protein ACFL3S_07155 [Gemmatimonadota bacterium]
MAQPAISFQLEDRDPHEGVLHLKAGETLRGAVTVQSAADAHVHSFRLDLHWRTEGKGNPAKGVGASVELAREGRWVSGATQSFSFVIQVPWGPLSHSGRILNVSWELEAKGDRSFPQADFRESMPVVLSAAPDMTRFDLGPSPQKERELEALKGGLAGLWLALGIILLLGGIVFGAAMGWEIQGVRRYALLAFMGLGFLLTLRGFWGRLGRGKLGEPTVRISSSELRRGEEVHFDVAIRPGKKTELRSLKAILECEERVVQGHGQYQSHHRKTIYEETVVLAEPRAIGPQRGLRKTGVLRIPADAPPTFGAPSNRVVWWLRFEADLAGWPDWKEPHLLTVRP